MICTMDRKNVPRQKVLLAYFEAMLDFSRSEFTCP